MNKQEYGWLRLFDHVNVWVCCHLVEFYCYLIVLICWSVWRLNIINIFIIINLTYFHMIMLFVRFWNLMHKFLSKMFSCARILYSINFSCFLFLQCLFNGIISLIKFVKDWKLCCAITWMIYDHMRLIIYYAV